jgi:DNA topoisomerase VI subunit B
MTEAPQSFFRRWRVVILFGVPVVVVVVVVREFVDYRSNSPIVDPHSTVINEMSLHSPRARQRLEQYYAKHQRQTVASKHYPWLCKEMRELADQDGVVWLLIQRSVPACPIPFDMYEKP